MGSSKKDISELPAEAKASFGARLYELQLGRTPLDKKPVTQSGAGVPELRESFDTNVDRVVHVLNREKALHVPCPFTKEIKAGNHPSKIDKVSIEPYPKRTRHPNKAANHEQ